MHVDVIQFVSANDAEVGSTCWSGILLTVSGPGAAAAESSGSFMGKYVCLSADKL